MSFSEAVRLLEQDFHRANTYLFVTNQHKPGMLAEIGSDLEKSRGVHNIFGAFSKAMQGDSVAYKFLDDLLGKAVDANIPSHSECLFRMINAAHPFQESHAA